MQSFSFSTFKHMKIASSNLGRFSLLVLLKAIYLCLVSGIVLLSPAGRDSAMGPVKHILWTPDGHPTFESYFTTWDAGHYLHLSEEGYHSGDEACAFYPLWPLLMRWFSILTGGDRIISGMLLANVFSLIGAFIKLKLVSRRFGEIVGWWSVAMLFAFPGSLFFQFIYSESQFFLLLMLLLFGLERGNFTMAFVAALLLPLTRAVGIFSVFPIAFHLAQQWSKNYQLNVVQHWWGRWLIQMVGTGQFEKPELPGASANANKKTHWWLLAAPFYGWAIYFILMWGWTNNPFEGFEAQKNWGVQSIGNLFNFPKFVLALFNPTVWHGFTGSLLDRCTFVLVLYCLPVIWRLDRTWFVWALVLGVVPAMSGMFTSFTRFASMAFPVYVALAVWLANPGRRHLRLVVLTSLVAMHFFLLWRFIFFQWAG